MKTILLLALATALHAAPILTPSGAITPIFDGYFLDLQTPLGTGVDARARLTSNVPLMSISFFVNNEPFALGSGLFVALDGVQVVHTGVEEWIHREFELGNGSPFWVVDFWTNAVPGWRERLTITGIVVEDALDDSEGSSVPEPSTRVLFAIGVVAFSLVWLVAKGWRG